MSDVHDNSTAELLNTKKLNHTECVMYRTVSNDFTEEEIKSFDYDMCVFFSPSGINAYTKVFPAEVLEKVAVATFGPTTAKTARDVGLRLDLEAPSKEFPSMTAALKDFLRNQKK